MKTYTIEGMTCGGCVGAVTKALERAGFAVKVALDSKTATIQGEPEDAVVIEAVSKAGFEASAQR